MFGTILTVSFPLPATTFTDTGQVDEVDASGSFTLPMAQIRAQRARSAQAGEHTWVAALLFAVGDPEVALDDLSLGAHNLFCAQPIACFWCGEKYRTDGTGPRQAAAPCAGFPQGPR